MPMRESRIHVVLRRALIVSAGVYAALFSWSIFRRTNQLFGLEVIAPSTIQAGASVGYDSFTSGTVPNPVRLELVQGERVELLVEQRGRLGFMDPWDVRFHRNAASIVVTPAMLTGFRSGPATLRLTGVAMQKLLRTPANKTREVEVTLAVSAPASPASGGAPRRSP
jgi:hypothetical protein